MQLERDRSTLAMLQSPGDVLTHNMKAKEKQRFGDSALVLMVGEEYCEEDRSTKECRNLNPLH